MAAKKQVRRETHEIPALSLRASVVPESFDEEKRTVEVVWTTGARVYRGGWFSDFYEELSLDPAHVRMDRLHNGAPLLNGHRGYDAGDVIGVVESARLEKGHGVARVRFAAADVDPAADAIFRKVKDKILRDVSVGYRVHKMEKVEEEEGSAPVYRATDWEPYEISIVPMGADPGGKVRAAGETNPCSFQETIKMKRKQKRSPEAEAETTEAAAQTTADEAVEESEAEATDPAAPAPAPAPVADERALREAALAERRRGVEIRNIATALRLPGEFVERHIVGGTPIGEVRKLAIAEAGKVSVVPARVEAIDGGDARDKWLRGAGDWLVIRAAKEQMVQAAAQKRGETVKLDAGEFRGLSFIDLARQCLERMGVRTAGMGKLDLIGKALTMRDVGGLHATADFPVLLENTLHKILLSSYTITPDTWRFFCGIGTVSDFRAHKRYRTGTIGRLQTVLEHGEYENLEIPDAEMESITAVTKGGMIGITRQALVNDDMDAFSRLAAMLGRAAALTIEAGVYDTLLLNSGLGPDMEDGDPLFDANHSNLGTDSVLGVAGIDGDRQLMLQQTAPGSDTEYLEIRPAVLLVPLSLGGAARVINSAEYDVDPVTTNATNMFMKPNRVRGLFKNVVDSPRLSGTRRYLFADPATDPALEVAFLEGQQAQYLEMREGWRVDGAEWKARLDFGIAAVDFRAAVTNDGAP